MARTNINVGTSANDGTGDTLRDAFVAVNAMTTEIYGDNFVTHDRLENRYNVDSRKSISLNTGFVGEEYNEAIEELLLSENVWVRWENKTLPILPKTKSLTYKTGLNDKTINYTVDFEFAFSKINNIR